MSTFLVGLIFLGSKLAKGPNFEGVTKFGRVAGNFLASGLLWETENKLFYRFDFFWLVRAKCMHCP